MRDAFNAIEFFPSIDLQGTRLTYFFEVIKDKAKFRVSKKCTNNNHSNRKIFFGQLYHKRETKSRKNLTKYRLV